MIFAAAFPQRSRSFAGDNHGGNR